MSDDKPVDVPVVQYRFRYYWPTDGTLVWRDDSREWNGQRPKESEGLVRQSDHLAAMQAQAQAHGEQLFYERRLRDNEANGRLQAERQVAELQARSKEDELNQHNKKIVAPIEMIGVREYAEGMVVDLLIDKHSDRLVIRAMNEGGHNATRVDLLDLIGWLQINEPDLLD